LRTLHRIVLSCTTLVLGSLVGGSALAEEQSDAAAAKAFAQGTELFKKHDYNGAIEAFEEAYRLRPHFMVQCNIARCHEWSGDFVHAIERYKRCLAEGAKGSETGTKAEASLAEAEKRITWVQVDSPGGGGTIYVDGKEAGTAPGKVAVNPGNHIVEVRRANATPASETVKTRGGEEKTVTLAPMDLTPKVGGGGEEPRPVRKRARLKPLWFWVAAGATAALGITAIGLGAGTLKARDKFTDNPTEDNYQSAVNLRMATNVLWGLTAAAAATGTVLFFYTDFRRSSEKSTTASFGVQGRF
jgi:hypothetical protein